MPVVWLNGELVDADHARVSALDRGVIWGEGLFETLRGYAGRPWAFDEHYARLRSGSDVLDLPIPAPAELRVAIDAVIGAEGLDECGVRVTITRGTGPVDPHAPATGAPNVLVMAWRLRDYSELYENGAALVTLPGWGRALPGVKTISYVASVAGRALAARGGADDALFVAGDGAVLEATGSNIFAAFGEELVTPPVQDGLLPGVTRGAILRVAADVGLRPREEGLWLDDLFTADEVLLTSTLKEVCAVRSVDGRDLSRGPLAARLRESYRAAVLRGM